MSEEECFYSKILSEERVLCVLPSISHLSSRLDVFAIRILVSYISTAKIQNTYKGSALALVSKNVAIIVVNTSCTAGRIDSSYQ